MLQTLQTFLLNLGPLFFPDAVKDFSNVKSKKYTKYKNTENMNFITKFIFFFFPDAFLED